MKTKIVIAGIGGVGGYFGGLLAEHYYENDNVDIIFYTRGAHLEEIKKNGLKVIKGDHEFVARPTLATNNPAEIGIADFIIIATKSYDLESIIQQLQPCINRNTILLPLLNGVDSKERIKCLLPDNLVLNGCVYIVSRQKQAGVIESSGHMQTLYFGLDDYVNDKMLFLENLFKEATIEATLSKLISTVVWEKYIFISPTATATCYFDNCIGELVADSEKLKTTMALMEEVKQIAKAKNILISDDIIEKSVNKLKALPFEATSSMHSDFKNKKSRNELETLTAFVVNEGQRLNLETPMYKIAYSELQEKTNSDKIH